jgi:hypothetical protein
MILRSRAMILGSRFDSRWWMVILTCISQGCDRPVRIEDSYPGMMGIRSEYKHIARIDDCEGLGEACPSGYIARNLNNSPLPKIYSYPRLSYLPSEFTMKWRTAASFDELEQGGKSVSKHRQVVVFPPNLKGSRGNLLFQLDANNHWSCKLTNEEWEPVSE